MEPHDDVVGEHALRVLFRSASLEWQFNLVTQLAFSNDLAGTVTIEIRVGDTVKLFVELHIHLFKRNAEKHVQRHFCAKRILNPLSCYAHIDKLTSLCEKSRVHVT